ncbi:glycosyltransferase family 2 protein [Azospirillum sp. ST 5-10]|uniref:glycosyltransferase family 2 protein n=1 Tax=unclassified Azospirillum TaxID=2630922 RepID=UPI003F4A72CC
MDTRGYGGRLASLLRWRSHRLRLTPLDGVAARGDRCRLTGPAGAFAVAAPDGSRPPAGRAILSYELDWDGEPPQLTLERTAAGDPATAVRLPLRTGAVRIHVDLPEGLAVLRIEAAAVPPSGFALRNPRLVETGPLTGAAAVLWGWLRPALADPRLLGRQARQAIGLLASPGGRSLLLNRLTRPQTRSYGDWVALYDTLDEADRRAIAARIAALPARPLISVLMPVYDPPERWLRRALDSVLGQLYPDWELCVADDASTAPHVRPVLEEYAARDPRIRVRYREDNGHISAASNSALEMATGAYAALLDHDDELAPHALYLVATEIAAHPDADLIYSDEDKIDEAGNRFSPYFKPDYNPDLQLSHNMVSHLGVYRTDLLRQIGGFRAGFEGSQDYDLVLRVIERTAPARIRHIPHVLYHWRAIAGSVALADGAKTYAHERARRAIAEHLARTGHAGATVVVAANPTLHRVVYPLPARPGRVTVIVPTKDRLDLLARCVDGVLEGTDYPDLELVVVDNRSEESATREYLAALAGRARARVLVHDRPYNYSAINNEAVAATEGAFLCFLNNDIEVIEPGWLGHMVSHALRPQVGAVGAKLLYPDGTVQHAGIVLAEELIAWHAHRSLPRHHPGAMCRAVLQQAFSAVTAACMVVRRSAFEEVGGFDADNLGIAFNDVDLCLRLGERGYRTLWTPYAELVHHESATLGAPDRADRRPQFKREAAYMARRWAAALAHDPAFNPNLDPYRTDFAPAFPPRAAKPWRAP